VQSINTEKGISFNESADRIHWVGFQKAAP